MIDALILDLGNVLAFHDNERLFAEFARVFDASRDVTHHRLGDMWDRVNRGGLPGDALRLEINSRMGGALSASDWHALWNCHFTLYEEMIREVEALVGRIPLVLLSNTHDHHISFLRPQLPVLERFDALVLSYELGHVKPEPEIYLEAVKRAGVPANRAAFFDDVKRYADAATSLGLHGRVFTTVDAFRRDLAALRPDLITAPP